jgi:predicted ABC-type exoprotein transport system permease subunit
VTCSDNTSFFAIELLVHASKTIPGFAAIEIMPVCEECKGEGYKDGYICTSCKGKGTVKLSRRVAVLSGLSTMQFSATYIRGSVEMAFTYIICILGCFFPLDSEHDS